MEMTSRMAKRRTYGSGLQTNVKGLDIRVATIAREDLIEKLAFFASKRLIIGDVKSLKAKLG